MRKSRLLVPAVAAAVGLTLVACSPESDDEETTSGEATSEEAASDEATEEASEDASADSGVGADLDLEAFEAVIAEGPVADDAAVEASEWASAVRDAGTLRVGGTETSNLFSLLDPTSGEVAGFDAGISQLLSQYILGEVATELTQVSVDTREELIVNGDVDTTIATYSITPERAERISFAGPYYSSQAAILVLSDNEDITSIDDLAGKTVATQANSTGETLLESEAPEAEILALPDHAQALESVINGNADAYVIDQTLLLNAVLAQEGAVKIVGEPFGPEDLYGIGVPLDSDAVDFVNEFLTTIIDDGTWADLWTVTIGDRTGVTDVPQAPTPGETGLS